MFYVYLLHSAKDDGFYIGFSTDLKRRLAEHTRGAAFATKSRGPWKLIYRVKGFASRGSDGEAPKIQ
jgi:putative endonuclease